MIHALLEIIEFEDGEVQLRMQVKGESRHTVHAIHEGVFHLNDRLGLQLVFHLQPFQLFLEVSISGQLISFRFEAVEVSSELFSRHEQFDDMLAGDGIAEFVDKEQSGSPGDNLLPGIGTLDGMYGPGILGYPFYGIFEHDGW